MRGKFIVIEGGDGAGKDTQIEMLKRDFSGSNFVYTKEVGGTPLGQYIRQALFHEAAGDVSVLAEFFLVQADRAQHVHEVVRPALLAGKTVISNRSWLSAFAYQIYGRDHMELEPMFKTGIDLIYEGCPLDLALVLDVPAAVGMDRQKIAGKTLDTMEKMPISLHERVRDGFLKLAEEIPQAQVIDATRTPDEVYVEVKQAVEAILAK